MFKRLRALAKGARLIGSTANYGRVQGLRDQTLHQLAELMEQRQILEDTMRPKYTEAQYQNSLARIEADERRLIAQLERYGAQLREISAAIDRRSLEIESIANPAQPRHGLSDFAEMMGFTNPEEFEDALAITAKAGLSPTQVRHHYQFLVSAYGQSAVTELAKLIREGDFDNQFPEASVESALEQLTDDDDATNAEQGEYSERQALPQLKAEVPGVCPLCSAEILELKEAKTDNDNGEHRSPTHAASFVAQCAQCSVTVRSAGPRGAEARGLIWTLHADDIL